jgi:hypothetical protein
MAVAASHAVVVTGRSDKVYSSRGWSYSMNGYIKLMMKLSPFVFATMAMLAATAVQADDALDSPFYVEADLGHVSVTRQTLQASGGGVDGTTTSKALVTGFDINQYFGIEGSYHDYGSPTAYRIIPGLPSCPQNFACPHITGFSAELVGHYEIMPRFSVEVLAGILHWNGSDPAAQLLGESSGSVALYGGRLLWAVTDNLSAGVVYQHSEFTTDETSLVLRYAF